MHTIPTCMPSIGITVFKSGLGYKTYYLRKSARNPAQWLHTFKQSYLRSWTASIIEITRASTANGIIRKGMGVCNLLPGRDSHSNP